MTKGFTLAVAVFVGVAAVDAADWPAVARSGSDTHLEGNRPSEGVAQRRSARHLDGEQSRERLWVDGRCW
jgi:hypothetical protein